MSAIEVRFVRAQDVQLGDVVMGLGPVQSYNEAGSGRLRTVTLYGDWGWRLVLPVGKGRCEVPVEVVRPRIRPTAH